MSSERERKLKLLELQRRRMGAEQTPPPQAAEEEPDKGVLDYALQGLDLAGGAIRAGAYGLHDMGVGVAAAINPEKEFLDYKTMSPTVKQIFTGTVPQYNEAFEQTYPELYKEHETAIDIGGFVGGMFSDPLSYARVTGAAARALKAKMEAAQNAKTYKTAMDALGSVGRKAGELRDKAVSAPMSRPIVMGGELAVGAAARGAELLSTHVVPTRRMYEFGVRKLDQFAEKYGKLGDYAPKKLLHKYGIFGSEKGIAKSIAAQSQKHEDMFWKQLDEYGDARVDLSRAKNEVRAILQKEIAVKVKAGHALDSEYLKPYKNAFEYVDKFKFTDRFNPRDANDFKTGLYNSVNYLERQGRGDMIDNVIKKFAQASKEQMHKAVRRKAFLENYPQAKEVIRNAHFEDLSGNLAINKDMNAALLGRQPVKLRKMDERQIDNMVDNMIDNPQNADMVSASNKANEVVNNLERTGQEWGTFLTIQKKSNIIANSREGRPMVSNVGVMAATYSPKIFAANQAHNLVTSPIYHTTMGYMVPEVAKSPAARRGLIELGDAYDPEEDHSTEYKRNSPWIPGGP